MRYLKTLTVVAVICLTTWAAPTAVHAARTAGAALSPDETAQTTTTVPSREGDTLDKFTGVAAVASILIVGVAGVYIYRLIRKGL